MTGIVRSTQAAGDALPQEQDLPGIPFAAGQLKRVPLLWQRLGPELLRRLAQDRRRLARRLMDAQPPILRLAADALFAASPTHAPGSRLDRQRSHPAPAES